MRTRRGFTMVEVVVALAIFIGMAVVLGGAYLGILTAYAQIDNESDYKNDLKFARAALLAESDFDTAEKGAEFDSTNGRHISWKSTIEPTETADLFAVTFECEISGTDLKEAIHLTEQFRLLRPTWSKVDERDKLRSAARQRIQQLQPNQSPKL